MTAAASVVVATFGRATLLPRLVAAVAAQEGAGEVELVVVDDGSPDDTWAVLQRLAAEAPVRLVPIRLDRNRGPAAARNAGWRAASAPLVAFTDDDCVPQPGWLAALVAALADADVVQGRTLPNPSQLANDGPFSRTLRVEAADGYWQTCNIGYRRAALERVDGFDERFLAPCGEDTDLAWRALAAGANGSFAADAVVLHDIRPSSVVTALRDTRRWAYVVLTLRLHPRLREHFHHRWFWKASHPPALLAVAGLALAARPGARPVSRAAALALTLPYVRFRTGVQPLRGGPRRRLAAIPGALAVDVAEVAVLARASARHRTLLL